MDMTSDRAVRQIAEHAGDIIISVDRSGSVAYASPAIRTFGYDPEDLIGRTGLDLVHPDDRIRFVENTEALLRGELVASADRQHRIRCADGHWAWVEGAPQLLRDEAGQPLGSVNVLRDVTARREAEAALRESEARLKLIAESTPDVIIQTDVDGVLVFVSPAVGAYGFAPAELVGRKLCDLIHPDDLERAIAKRARTLGGEPEAPGDRAIRYRTADGGWVWLEGNARPLHDSAGEISGTVNVLRDVTARRAAEAALRDSEARHRVIAETTVDLITMAGLDGTLTFVSPSVRQIGYEPEALIGSQFAPNVHPDDVRPVWRGLKALMEGAPTQRHRWRARHGVTGEWRWMESAPSLTRDPDTGHATGLIDVVRDITAQVEQEEALKAAQAAAEAATAVKAQFLANMSHEIRNPLTAVLGFTDILRKSTALADADRAHVERIAGAGSALLAIVNDVLDFSKLESGMVTVTPKPTSIVEVGRESLLLFEGQAATKGLALVFEADDALPATMMVDGDRVRQVLINLTANAVKFTERGTVALRVLRAGDAAVRLEVSDTGVGLSGEDCARLFQRFTQIEGPDGRRHGGTGLGLAICKGLAEAMGGAIGVDSTVGQGSTFHLTLPAAPVETRAPSDPMAGLADLTGARILVVDDNAANRELAACLLTPLGADLTSADCGLAALAQLAAHPFDVVLVDLRMPDVDGPEVLRRLRATSGPNQHIPVLAFTAEPPLAGAKVLDGFDGLVGKPIDIEELASALSAAVSWTDR